MGIGFKTRVAIIAIGLTAKAAFAQADVLFVRADALEGARNGGSWADAFTDLLDALGSAAPGDSIWVAAGVYVPGIARGASFELSDGVALVGGFAGDEVPGEFDLDGRDLVRNETVLSGNLGSESAYHVVVAERVGPAAVVDGFTITGGNAAGLTDALDDVGGGLLIVEASPTIRRCNFVSNQAGTKGGAVHIAGGSATFISCRFLSSATTVTQFGRNFGGAVFVQGATFSTSTPSFVNCLFRDNRAGVGLGGEGGAMYVGENARPSVANCTIIENQADGAVGGVHGSAVIVNSVLWGNRGGVADGNAAQIGQVRSVSYSLLPEDDAGAGNVSGDPVLVPRESVSGFEHPRDLIPAPGSGLIDAGGWSESAESEMRDLGGVLRAADDPATPDTGQPSPLGPVLDIGAFEYQALCATDADCDDGRPCNGSEVCSGGRCVLGVGLDCDDGVACTVDRCDEEAATCTSTPADQACDDGVFCNGVEVCDALVGCVSGEAPNCNDGIGCTIDTCDEASRACAHEVDANACDDGDPCNGQERCDSSIGCASGDPIDCDDGIDCTIDTCDISNGRCNHVADDASCDDGSFCNGPEICDAETGCLTGVPPCIGLPCDEAEDTCEAPVQCDVDVDCDDGDACTVNRCSDGTCMQTFSSAACDDGDACTSDDRCEGGVCIGDVIPGCGDLPAGGGGGGGSSGGDASGGGGESGSVDDDLDGDGVADLDDECAKTAVGAEVDPAGCSCDQRDSDADGIDDCNDVCASSPAAALVDDMGCPLGLDDQPQDGAPDDGEVGTGADPDAGQGSPDVGEVADSDGDGVADVIDLCPNTAAEIDTDELGCPMSAPDDNAAGGDLPVGQAFGASPCGACGPVQAVALWPALLLMTIVRVVRRHRIDGRIACAGRGPR